MTAVGLLGAHVSTAGGVHHAPGRGVEIGATAIQIFTKQPSRWAEPVWTEAHCCAYTTACADSGVGYYNSHDSYLINLATPDPVLRDRSYAAFRGELERAVALGLDAVVSHPGNSTDGDRARGIAQNAALVEQALHEVPGRAMVLLETTAGSGHALGACFEELAALIDGVSPDVRHRVGVCFDTCHVFSAGYALDSEYEGVITAFSDTVGLERIRLFHLNDSLTPFASRRDRHADIGMGSLGDGPFRSLMTDPRFVHVPKVLETPKGDDPVGNDRRNLARLRSYAAE